MVAAEEAAEGHGALRSRTLAVAVAVEAARVLLGTTGEGPIDALWGRCIRHKELAECGRRHPVIRGARIAVIDVYVAKRVWRCALEGCFW